MIYQYFFLYDWMINYDEPNLSFLVSVRSCWLQRSFQFSSGIIIINTQSSQQHSSFQCNGVIRSWIPAEMTQHLHQLWESVGLLQSFQKFHRSFTQVDKLTKNFSGIRIFTSFKYNVLFILSSRKQYFLLIKWKQ